jgi:eukaryotic-like serine/threonine-protein kinase
MTHDDSAARARRRLGTVLKDRWTLEAVLGIGGMGTVYSARHRNGKRVAIKMLHSQLSLEPTVRGRFLREGYVANAVGHPGAVTVDDDDVAPDGSAFLVMELLEGQSVEGRSEGTGGRLPDAEVIDLVDALLDVLIAAHGKGIVHRDIKPDNLFLTEGGALKVLDFGIARLREISQTGSAITASGSLLGTPAYMAPEQARGKWDLIDGRTDLWAVGATMFRLLSGEFVHQGDTVNEMLGLSMMTPPRSIASVRPDLPSDLAAVVDKALAFEPDDRFAHARAMQSALRDAARGHDFPRTTSTPRREPSLELAPTVAAESRPGTSARTPDPGATAPGVASAARAGSRVRRAPLALLGLAAAGLLGGLVFLVTRDDSGAADVGDSGVSSLLHPASAPPASGVSYEALPESSAPAVAPSASASIAVSPQSTDAPPIARPRRPQPASTSGAPPRAEPPPTSQGVPTASTNPYDRRR